MPSASQPPQDLRVRGERLLSQGRLEEACDLLQRAAELSPRDWRAQRALGEAYLQDGRLEQALQTFQKTLRCNASDVRTHLGLADVHSAAGRRQEAEAAIREALRLAPTVGHGWLRLVHLRRFRDASDPDLQALRTLASSGTLAPIDAEPIHFALGKALDELDQRQESFAHLKAANELHKKRQRFDVRLMLQLTDRIAAAFGEQAWKRTRGWGIDSSLPVFVVGMPRCGSTLIEQIVASHPQGSGVGELRTLPRLVGDLPSRLRTRVPFPECIQSVTQQAIQGLASDYLRRLSRDVNPQVTRVCDKMLSNLLLVGVIAMALPGARIIHCRRNLMDLGLSMYMQSFAGSGVGYAYDLEDIGMCHRAFESLMTHWRRTAPVSIVPLQYEELVSDPREGVRAVLDAAGLPWDEACMRFHASERQVLTVSEWQVRQPIHNRSVGRWRGYEEQLEPLRKYVSEPNP